MTRRWSLPVRTTGALLALVLIVSLSAVGLASAGAAPSTGACSRTPTYQVKLESRASWYTFNSNRTAGGRLDQYKEFLRKNVNAGTTTLVYDMCKVASTGRWKVNRMLVRAPHRDLSVTVVGKKIKTIKPATDSAYGFGAFIRKRSDTSVTFHATRCTKKPVGVAAGSYRVLKGVLGLPWKTSSPIAVGLYVAGQVLPDAPEDKYWCARMDDPLTLKVRFRRSDGRPSIAWPGSGQVGASVKTPQREYPCSGETYVYCSDSDWQVFWLRKP